MCIRILNKKTFKSYLVKIITFMNYYKDINSLNLLSNLTFFNNIHDSIGIYHGQFEFLHFFTKLLKWYNSMPVTLATYYFNISTNSLILYFCICNFCYK